MNPPAIPQPYSLAGTFANMAAPFKALASGNAPAMPSLASPLTTTPPATTTGPTTSPTSAVGPTQGPVGGASYTVNHGDTLSTIAQKNNMSLSQILAYNPQYAANPNVVRAGDSIALGGFGTQPVPATPPASTTPTVPPPVNAGFRTATDGSVINANTGGVIPPPPPAGVTPSVGTPNASGAPATPAVPAPNPLSSPLYTSPEYEAAVKAYQGLQAPTADETQNATDLANLDASYRTAYTNTKGQPIPLEFQTGENNRLLETKTNLAAPLEAQAALLQAKRTAALNAGSFAVQQAEDKISAYRDVNKPVAVAYGGSLANPQTGATIVPAFAGSGATTGAGISPATGLSSTATSSDILGYLAMNGIDTTRYNTQGLIAAVQNGATAQDIVAGRGAAAGVKAAATTTANAGPAADAASLKTQQAYLDTTNRAYSTATANLGTLQSFMTKYNLNNSSIPIANQLTNAVKSGIADPGAVAAFNTTLQGLRAEYAQVLARGGEVTDSSRAAANSLIPDDLSPAQLAIVTSQLSKEGTNAIAEAGNTVKTIQARINGGSGSGSSSSAPAGFGWNGN